LISLGPFFQSSSKYKMLKDNNSDFDRLMPQDNQRYCDLSCQVSNSKGVIVVQSQMLYQGESEFYFDEMMM
jgi:hypothetical protein